MQNIYLKVLDQTGFTFNLRKTEDNVFQNYLTAEYTVFIILVL